MATNKYYILEGISAFVFIIQIFTTSELCGEFVGKQRLRETTGACSSMTLFGLNFSDGAEEFPVSQNVCYNISFFSYSHSLQPQPLQAVTNHFAVPIAFSMLYLFMLLVHTVGQMPPEYGPCENDVAVFGFITWTLISTMFGFITWTLIFMEMTMLRTNWDDLWLCSNFKAVIPSFVWWSPFFSAMELIGCAIQILRKLLPIPDA